MDEKTLKDMMDDFPEIKKELEGLVKEREKGLPIIPVRNKGKAGAVDHEFKKAILNYVEKIIDHQLEI